LDYAFHFHFFGKLPSAKDSIKKRKEEILSQWLLEVRLFCFAWQRDPMLDQREENFGELKDAAILYSGREPCFDN